MKIRKRLVFAVSLAIVVTGLVWTAESYLPKLFVMPGRRMSAEPPSGSKSFDARTEDGLTLKCWFVPASSSPRGTVIIQHGWGGCRSDCLQFILPFVKHGYNAIAFDSRAHGQSGGIYCTYGYREKDDVLRLITEAKEQFPDLGPVAMLGTSYGGAVTTQALALDPNIRCGIIVSGFCRLEDVARTQFKLLTGLSNEWLFQHVAVHGAAMAGFRLEEVQPTESARSIRQPVLVVHGDLDELVPLADAKNLYAHIPAVGKEWYEAKGADHGGILRHEPLLEHIIAFLDRWMKSDQSEKLGAEKQGVDTVPVGAL